MRECLDTAAAYMYIPILPILPRRFQNMERTWTVRCRAMRRLDTSRAAEAVGAVGGATDPGGDRIALTS